jgi:hypothetical protein
MGLSVQLHEPAALLGHSNEQTTSLTNSCVLSLVGIFLRFSGETRCCDRPVKTIMTLKLFGCEFSFWLFLVISSMKEQFRIAEREFRSLFRASLH